MPQVAVGAVLAGVASGITVSGASIAFSLTMTGFLASAGSSLLLGGAQMLLSSGGQKSKAAVNSTRASSTQNVRQAITTHKLVYGQRLVAGPITVISSSQDNLYLHLIVTISANKMDEIGEIWFNDECIPPDHLDATGNVIAGRYSGYARIRKLLGDPAQAADPYMVGEVAEWSNNHRQRGRAYLYVRLKYSQDKFASGVPNISAVVRGKKIYDPRDSTYKFTGNAALIARDYLADAVYGFEAEGSIDDASVIAAANVCDEIVDTQMQSLTIESVDTALDTLELNCDILPYALGDRIDLTTTGALPSGLAAATDYYAIPYQFKRQSGDWAGNKPRLRLASSFDNAMAGIYIDISSAGSGVHTARKTGEPRFHGAAYIDSGKTLGENLGELLSGFGGRAVFAGGLWRILSATYVTPTVTISENDLIAPLMVQTKISRSERFNQIKGVYTSQLNDWQAADYPALKDSTAVANDGQEISRDYDLPVTNRPYTAQRIAKIELKKAVQELVVRLQCNLMGLQVQAGDTVMVDNARLGWSAKVFEVTDFKFVMGGSGETPELGVELTLRETVTSIFDWASTEESTIDDAPNTNLPNPFIVTAVSGLSFDSIPTDTRDGDIVYSMVLNWSAHPDAFVNSGGSYEIQYKLSSDASYRPSFVVDGELTSSTIAQASVGTAYDIRIRAVNNIGVRSGWQYLLGVVTGSSGGVTSTEDWGLSTASPTSTEDWGLSTDAPTTTEDWGSSS